MANQDESFLDEILAMEEERAPRIKKSLFAAKYLPLLVDPQGMPDAVIKMWIDQVAETAQNRVFVVDDNTGEVLYRVPPLIGAPMPGNTGYGGTISERMSYVAVLQSQLGALGNRALENALSERNIVLDEGERYRLEWYRILRDFNLLDKAGVPKEVQDAINGSASLSGDKKSAVAPNQPIFSEENDDWDD